MIRSVQTIIQNKVQASSLRQALKLGQTLVQIIKTELYEQTALTVQTKEQVIAKSRMQNERTLLRAKAETARERLESEIAAEQQRKGLVVLSVENRKQEADGQDIVVVIGQDGLVANTLKYLDGQPVIAINPDPACWDGRLLPFGIRDLKSIVKRTMAGKGDSKAITFAEAKTNDGQRMLAVNDLFIGPKTHTSARYVMHWNGQEEGVVFSDGIQSDYLAFNSGCVLSVGIAEVKGRLVV